MAMPMTAGRLRKSFLQPFLHVTVGKMSEVEYLESDKSSNRSVEQNSDHPEEELDEGDTRYFLTNEMAPVCRSACFQPHCDPGLAFVESV